MKNVNVSEVTWILTGVLTAATIVLVVICFGASFVSLDFAKFLLKFATGFAMASVLSMLLTLVLLSLENIGG